MKVKKNEANIKLVICDIDDTLIVKHQMLSLRAKSIIHKLKDNQIYFGIASGRSLEELNRMIHSWGFKDIDVMIGLNGSILWDGIHKKKYNYFKLKKPWIKEIINLMEPFNLNPLMYREDKIICKNIDDVVKMSAKTAQMDIIKVKDISTFYQYDNAKIMFRVNEVDMEIIEEYLLNHPSPNYQGFKTQSTLMEFSDKRVSKAYAIKKFCALHNFTMEEVIAFGDTTNDNSMLEAAGIGVCLKNGSQDTKNIADFITKKTCDEDGWADYMETKFFDK